MKGDEYITVPLDSVPVDIALPYPILVRIGDTYVTLRTKEDCLTRDRLEKLAEKGVKCLYICQKDWLAFIGHLESALDRIGIREGSEESALGVRNVLLGYLRIIEERRELEQAFLTKLMDMADKLSVAIGHDLSVATKMLRRYADASMYFSNHAVNTAVYSITIGLKLRLSVQSLKELALAACVANLGNMQVPTEILYKPKPLQDSQWEVIKKHPEQGSKLLKLLLAPSYVWETAQQHHERFDGRGYPHGLEGKHICEYARIVSLAEVFSATTSLRPWASPLQPEEAIRRMRQLTGKFDPAIFKFVAE